MDPRLVAFAAAAERGSTVPPVGILTGAWLIQGTPVSYAAFYEASTVNLANQLHQAMPPKQRKAYDDRDAELWGIFRTRIAVGLSALGDPVQPDALALNIAPAQAGANGSTLHVPALRVPLSAIRSWWVTSFVAEEKSPFFFGVAVAL